MTARDRFKAMLADALERLCILQEQVEEQALEIAQLKLDLAEVQKPKRAATRKSVGRSSRR